ncbi:regulator of microtubule dynamics protein 2 [Anabrus simplex]|uniref:regulator of microtubule dynamics protein 2 n=1 Tax=Anabrus simplex TaxID=316456 RepID=UPI0035A36F73
MNADFLRYRGLLAAAVGAGVLLGAAGIFLYHQLYAERRRLMLQREVAKLGSTVAELKEELEALRRVGATKPKTAHRRRKVKSVTSSSDVDSDVEMFSAVGADDDGEDEFFDISDDETFLDLEKETDPKLAKLFETIDILFKGTGDDKRRAYNMMLDHHQKSAPSVGLLWRLAKASHFMAIECNENLEKKKEYVLQGCSFAQQALELDDRNSEAHKWFAVLVGSRGEFMGIKGRIEDGFVFKQHVDRALTLHPTDPSLHHLLGRFKYEVAMLSWMERKVAGTLFAEPPSATHKEALENFLRAEELSPVPWKENELFIAKCYISEGNFGEAIHWLERAAKVIVNLPQDESVENEIQDLLTKYQNGHEKDDD